MLSTVDVGSPKNRDPFETFLYWAFAVCSAFFFYLRACAERLSF